MIDGERYVEQIKAALIGAWRNGNNVVLPMKDLMDCEVLSIWSASGEVPILRVDIPMLVDDNGFRFKIEDAKNE